MPELPKTLKTNYKTPKRKRKYSTDSTIWRKIRKAQLARQPLCEECSKQGTTTAANTVDHVDGDTYNNLSSNLASLCVACHSRKGVLHDGGLGRKVNRKK